MSKFNLNVKIYRNGAGSILDITPYLTKVVWKGALTNVCRSLDITYIFGTQDTSLPTEMINSGDIAYLYIDGTEIFRGEIITKNIVAESNQLNFNAVDYAYYLKKSKVSFNFSNITADKASKQIINSLELEEGELEASDIEVNRLLSDVTGYDAIMQMYTELHKQNSKFYYLYMNTNKVCVTEVDKILAGILITPNTSTDGTCNGNIISLTFTDSMQNMINRIQVLDSTGKKIDTIDAGNTSKYGVLQELYKQETGKDYKTVCENMLQGVEYNVSCEVLGDVTYITGNSVKIKYPLIEEIKDNFMYIQSDTHTWNFKNGQYITSLELSYSQKMDEKEYSASSTNNISAVALYGSAGEYKYCTTEEQKQILSLAFSQLGVPYVWGGNEWNVGMDCSGFTQQVYAHYGITLSRTTYTQVYQGSQVSKDELEPGDLVFPREDLGHVQIYIGGDQVIHEPKTGDVCKVSDMTGFYTARRILETRTPITSTASDADLSNATKMDIQITAYTSLDAGVGFTTASGKTVAYGMCASNIYPFGTKFYLTGISGVEDGIWEVQDRGGNEFNSASRLDLYLGADQSALDWANQVGRQNITGYKLN
ncbi:XkdQ/YqbQ family protein [Clostridium beijerinckii]|uniref:C40 family peptidase n=1 Tax=Clostridium beijerinckii TaxID=1520 RepID=UPI001493FE6D|nr:NlpC/P60 family protein [Clostridium beijerinckii]NOW03238.1 3D (Asp-Asp-Asp) domain-containing protein [Clostridium beijerinckii]NYC03620.1 3D (Asp-Asp-Asp) domain-containing protein [Clostridium beijerinckii]